MKLSIALSVYLFILSISLSVYLCLGEHLLQRRYASAIDHTRPSSQAPQTRPLLLILSSKKEVLKVQ